MSGTEFGGSGRAPAEGSSPSDGISDASRPPSPYVDIYMARGQVEMVLKTLRHAAEGKAPSNPLWAAIRTIERAAGHEPDSKPLWRGWEETR